MTGSRTFIVIVTSLSASWCLLAGTNGVAEEKGTSGDLQLADSPADAVQQILAGWKDPSARERIDALGEKTAVQAEQAAAALDVLEQDFSIEAATLRADLLIWMARGDETPKWKRKGRDFEPETMGTDELGRRAAQLLDHPDPFVRGLAEWAIAIRLAPEYECAEERANGRRIAKQWPDEHGPDWYRKWAAIRSNALLDLDYVRQAAALGVHRTTEDLAAHAATWVERSEKLLAHIRETASPAQVAFAEGRHARVLSAFVELEQAAKQSPQDVTRCRLGYLKVRHALRDLVFANPDVNFDRVVFGVRQAPRSSGNITVGRWNTHTPGGDIYVKRGFHPEDPAEPLLAAAWGQGMSAAWNSRGMPISWSSPTPNSRGGRMPAHLCRKRTTSEDTSARASALSKKCRICLR